MNIQTLIEKYPDIDKDTLKLIVIDVIELIKEEKSLQVKEDNI